MESFFYRIYCIFLVIMGFIIDFYFKVLFFVLFLKCGLYFKNGFLRNFYICMNLNEIVFCLLLLFCLVVCYIFYRVRI